MRICIDVQSAVTQRAGIGRYTRALVHHLAPLLSDHELRLFYLDFKRRGARLAVPGAIERPVRWCPGALIQQAWKRLNWPPVHYLAGKADVYHFPNFICPPLRRGRAVVTIHDMSFARFPEFTETGNLCYLRARMGETVKRADAIVTISRFSAREISRLLDVEPARVFPIYPGISPDFQPPPPDTVNRHLASLGIKKPYLLTVGTLEPRKNLPLLVDTFDGLDAFKGQLVIAGAPGWKTGPILRHMQEARRARDIRYIRYVPDAALPSLYAGAELFLLTSHYEGFGFPPVEAMACGSAVVSSTGGSLGEVLDGGARLVDATEPDAWIAAIASLLADPDARHALARRGREHAGRYRWDRCAAQTRDVYLQVGGRV